MKIYEIRDEECHESIGILLYYEKQKAYIVELQDGLDEWTAPLLFAGLVKKHIYTVPQTISRLWVHERVIPIGRQNIGSILDNHKMKEYDEMKFLEASRGKCSQDHLFIRNIDELPQYVSERMKRNVVECIATSDGELLCFFADDTVKKIDLNAIREVDGVDKIQGNRQLMESGKVGVGGYSVTFGDTIDIPAGILHDVGVLIPLTITDFRDFVQKNIYDTSQSCRELECSRQNLAYMQEKGLAPLKENVKGSLFLRGDIQRQKW